MEKSSQTQHETSAPHSTGGAFWLRRKCACDSDGSSCDACNTKREGELRRAALNSAGTGFAPGIVSEVLESPGRPLDSATRAFMEPRFGRDFSDVRVHTDSRAAESARAVNALAYTVGRDMVFGEGKYAPGTREGKGLLAHELTHVAQNSAARWNASEPLSIGPPGDRFEAEADARASAMARGDLRAAPGGAVTPNREPGRMSRSTFQVGSQKIEVNFDALGNMPAAEYEKEIEKRFTSWTKAKASTIHASVTKLSAIQKEFVLFGLDLLEDNPLTGLDKIAAVNRLIARAPKANTRPLGGKGNEFAEEVLSVTGWFEKALASGLSAPTGTSLATVQGLLGVTSSGGGSSPSASCPSPRKSEDQLKKADFQTELPKRLVTYLGKVAIAKTPVAQAMSPLLKAADEVQKQARSFYSPYADRSTGTGNTMLQRWQYSAHTISSQSAQATPSKDVRTAYIASRSQKVGDLGLFSEMKYDWRCASDKKVLADLVTNMEKDTTIQPMVDKILREKSYTAQDADPKFVVLDPQYDSSKVTECEGRWKTIKTMCHEMMHVLVHPNFHNAEKNRQLLTEGFPEVLGHYLYKDIRGKAGSDAKLKGLMEDGVSTAPCKTIPDSKIEYVPGGPNAEKIRGEVGDNNFRAAFFLGEVSLVGIQPKRIDGAGSNEPQEREADDAAEAVTQSRPLQTSISRTPFALQAGDLIAGSGSGLPPGVQRDMERTLGQDFSKVRVHTNAGAEQLAGSLNARAYTVGRDIGFGASQYAPQSREGRSLLAHELTHVIQQSGTSPRTTPIGVANSLNDDWWKSQSR